MFIILPKFGQKHVISIYLYKDAALLYSYHDLLCDIVKKEKFCRFCLHTGLLLQGVLVVERVLIVLIAAAIVELRIL